MSTTSSRRAFFRTLACGCLAASAGLFPHASWATDPKARTAMTAEEALASLKDGNAAFVNAGACAPTGGAARLAELARGQAPFAVIVSCSDSRTPPEVLFNKSLGELFVIRVAGGVVDRSALGSIEYGVAVLGAPLVLVLGHSQCGAVEAAARVVTDNARFPGAIGELIAPIVPAVLKARSQGGDLLAASIDENVRRVTAQIVEQSPLVAAPVKSGKASVVGGIYDLATGKVAFMA